MTLNDSARAPHQESHTYVAKAAWRDSAMWLNIISFAVAALELTQVTDMVPPQHQPKILLVVALLNLFVRFFLTRRPVALEHGTPVEVVSIPPKV